MADDRDWDRELAKIDKLMGADPPPAAPPVVRRGDPGLAAPAAPATPAASRSAAAPSPVGPTPRSALRVWAWTLLGPLGVMGLWLWPYTRGCGLMLGVYLVGVAAVLGAALVTLRSAWLHRRGVALTIGIVTLVAALALATAEVLPRVGYAAHALQWSCTT
jgi:hypothetical protein